MPISDIAGPQQKSRRGALRTLARDERGGIAVIAAVAMIGILGTGALAVEVGNAYSVQVRNQRVADMAALGAALAFADGANEAVLDATADDIAAANGLGDGTIDVAVTTSPSNPSEQAIRVSVTSAVPLRLASVLTDDASLSVGASAWAQITPGAPACVIALSGSAKEGISAGGGTRLTASNCAIAANSDIATNGGAQISAAAVYSSKNVSSVGGSSVTTTPKAGKIYRNRKNAAVDPLVGNGAVSAAFAELAKVGTRSTAAMPLVPAGENFALDWSPKGVVASYFNSGREYHYEFPAGVYNIKKLTIAGGLKVRFLTNATSVVTVSGDVAHGGSALVFGDGELTVVGGLNVGGGTNVTIGHGIHRFGSIDIGGGSSMTVGAGDVLVNGPIKLNGDVGLAFGAGTAEVNGDITLQGSARLTFGPGQQFVNGTITTHGNTALSFGPGTAHRIDGDLDIKGSVSFGAGTYYVNGEFANNTGGSMTGTDVSFILRDGLQLSGGTTLNLAAPKSAGLYGIHDLLFASRTTEDAKLRGSTQNIYSGTFYMPNAKLDMAGGAGVNTDVATCMMLVANTIDLQGGSAGGTSCPGIAGSRPVVDVALVQ